MLPQAGIFDAGKIGTGQKHAVGMAAEESIGGAKAKHGHGTKSETRCDQPVAALRFEKTTTVENVSYSCRVCRINLPIVLYLPQAFSTDNRSTQIVPQLLDFMRGGLLDQR